MSSHIKRFVWLALFCLCVANGLVPTTAAAFYFISSGGGQCEEIGEWNAETATCKLATDLTDYIAITSPLVTLDGQGHTIDLTGSVELYGVHVDEVVGVTVKNLVLVDAGIYFERSDAGQALDNTINSAFTGINFFDLNTGTAENNIIAGSVTPTNNVGIVAESVNSLMIRNNQINNVEKGLNFDRVSFGSVSENDIRDVAFGFDFTVVSNLSVTGNSISASQYAFFFQTDDSEANTVTGNTFQNAEVGLQIVSSDDGGDPTPTFSQVWGGEFNWTVFAAWIKGSVAKLAQAFGPISVRAQASENVFSQNNFINNESQTEINRPTDILFSLPLPDGGNYWDTFDEVSEGCDDADTDGFCDSAYGSLLFVSDDFPRSVPVEIVFSTSQCSDGIDNDGDGLTDYPDDPGCESLDDRLEINVPPDLSVIAAPEQLSQYKMFGEVPIESGGTTISNTAVFEAELPELTNVRLEVELKEVENSFNGENTILSEPASGGVVQATKEELIPKDEQYEAGGNVADFKWRARSVSESGQVSDWVEFQSAGEIAFTAKVVPLFTQVSSDFPSSGDTATWFGEDYADGRGVGSCGLTIAQCGCAVTSVVMTAHFYDIRTDINDKAVQPLNLDAWLVDKGGYNAHGSIIWASVEAYTGNKLAYRSDKHFNIPENPLYQNTAGDFARIDEFVVTDSPMPVIGKTADFKVHGGIKREHFFVIGDKIDTQNYVVHDPSWFETTTLDDPDSVPKLVRRYEGSFDGLRVYEKGSGLATSYTPYMNFSLGSPAELLFTDAEGRKIGKDPRTGEEFNEIPGALYYKETISNPDEDVPDPENVDADKILMIPNGTSGEYTLEVIGTGGGDYTLTARHNDTNGEHTYTEFHSDTDLNQVATYEGTYDPEDIETAVIQEETEAPTTAKELFSNLIETISDTDIKPRLLKVRLLANAVLAKGLFEHGGERLSRIALQNLENLVTQRTGSGISEPDAQVILDIINELQILLR